MDTETKNEERTASKRVSHCDCAAVDVDFLVRNADCVNGVNGLAGERLVNLEEVDVLCENAHVSVDEAKERKKASNGVAIRRRRWKEGTGGWLGE